MRYRKNTGASAVEFALIAPIFFLLIFAIIEFGLQFWMDLTMQYAVREGTRFAITGQTGPDANQRYLEIIEKMDDSSMGLWAKVDPKVEVTVVTAEGATTTTSYNDPKEFNNGMFGKPTDVITVRINCRWPPFTSFIGKFFTNGEHDFSVAATMQNEGSGS